MKTIKYMLACMLAIFVTACNDGIDSITPVAPGPDETAPVVKVNYPTDGLEIFLLDEVISINLQADVSDDIELGAVSFKLNGAEIAKFDQFKDYRRAELKYTYDNLTNGDYVFTVDATDLSGKTASQSVNFSKTSRYQPKYEGEIFYMPFNDNFKELVSDIEASKVGSPVFGEGITGLAYKGVDNAYLTFPTTGLLGSEFSAAFWYKVNATPDRAGILVISPVDTEHPEAMNNRTSGFRFFREGSGTSQTLKLNVGNGTADTWFDGGAAASLNPASAGWVFVAFTISSTECAVYIDGEVVNKGDFSGVSWEGCDRLSIASGAPRFTEWSHFSDLSMIDELRLFNKALTAEEIKALME
jgi:hypothetical protein